MNIELDGIDYALSVQIRCLPYQSWFVEGTSMIGALLFLAFWFSIGVILSAVGFFFMLSLRLAYLVVRSGFRHDGGRLRMGGP